VRSERLLLRSAAAAAAAITAAAAAAHSVLRPAVRYDYLRRAQARDPLQHLLPHVNTVPGQLRPAWLLLQLVPAQGSPPTRLAVVTRTVATAAAVRRPPVRHRHLRGLGGPQRTLQ